MSPTAQKYPLSMRILHWLRAAILLGTLLVGLLMVNLPDDATAKFETLYPNHKQFGVLALLLVLVQVALRLVFRGRLPGAAAGLEANESWHSKRDQFVTNETRADDSTGRRSASFNERCRGVTG